MTETFTANRNPNTNFEISVENLPGNSVVYVFAHGTAYEQFNAFRTEHEQMNYFTALATVAGIPLDYVHAEIIQRHLGASVRAYFTYSLVDPKRSYNHYEYPEGLTAAEKKSFRAKARREQKKA